MVSEMKFNNILVVNKLMDDYNNLIKLSKFDSNFITYKIVYKNGREMINRLEIGVIALINKRLRDNIKETKHTIYSVHRHKSIIDNMNIDFSCVTDFINTIDNNSLIINLHQKYKFKVYENYLTESYEVNDTNLKIFNKLAKTLRNNENHWIFNKDTMWIRLPGFYKSGAINKKKDIESVLNCPLIRYCLSHHIELPIRIVNKDIKQQLNISNKENIKNKHIYDKFRLGNLEISYLENKFKVYSDIDWKVNS